MNWIEERIAELDTTRQAFSKDYTKLSSVERGNVSLILTHLDMHIADLEKVKSEQAAVVKKRKFFVHPINGRIV